MNILDWIERHREWSQHTFGTGNRTKGILSHIRKELGELESSPDGIFEWIDVIILAIDGALQRGFLPEQIVDALIIKQQINFTREWPKPGSPDEPIEHIRGNDDLLTE